jgi:hypothetical protein
LLREGLKPIERQSSLIPADRPLSLCYCFVNVAMLLRPRRVIRITATIQSLALPSPRLRHRADLFRIVNEKLISLRAQGRCGFLTLPAAQAAEAERSAKANVHTTIAPRLAMSKSSVLRRAPRPGSSGFQIDAELSLRFGERGRVVSEVQRNVSVPRFGSHKQKCAA